MLSGSPPHTRGKAVISVFVSTLVRITPAYAGKSFNEQIRVISFRDHPRIRGEKFRFPWLLSSRLGSPPHTRGKDFIETPPFNIIRITPAYAGKRYVVRINEHMS